MFDEEGLTVFFQVLVKHLWWWACVTQSSHSGPAFAAIFWVKMEIQLYY